MAVSGDHAYIGDGSHGLRVIDISDPTNPVLAGTCGTPGRARGVAVSGDHAFVAADTSGLQVVDISDPTNPVLLGDYDTPGYACDVAVAGDHAFMVGDFSGLEVIDISVYDSNPLASWIPVIKKSPRLRRVQVRFTNGNTASGCRNMTSVFVLEKDPGAKKLSWDGDRCANRLPPPRAELAELLRSTGLDHPAPGRR